MVGEMDPNSVQFSIETPFGYRDVGGICRDDGSSGTNSLGPCHRSSVGILQRYRGWMTHLSIFRSFTLAHHERQAYGVPTSLSNNYFHTPVLGFFSLASVRGNSRALVLAIVRRNQTRILFVLNPIWAFLGSLIAAHQTKAELDVPYTVIRAHLLMGEHSALTSDYLKDFYSFCFTGKGALCMRFTDEFTSRTPQLNTVLNEEKNKENWEC